MADENSRHLLFQALNTSAQDKKDSLRNSLDAMYTPRLGGIVRSQSKLSKNKSDIIYALRLMLFDLLRGNVVIENEINVKYAATIIFGKGYNVMPDRIRLQIPQPESLPGFTTKKM